MTEEQWYEKRIDIATSVLQGLLERTTGLTSKLFEDVFYHRTAKEAVKYTDALIKELRKNDRQDIEET